MWPCTKLCKWKHTKGNQFIRLDDPIIWNCSQSVTDMKNFFLLPVGSLLTWPESLGSTPFLKIRLFMHNYLAPTSSTHSSFCSNNLLVAPETQDIHQQNSEVIPSLSLSSWESRSRESVRCVQLRESKIHSGKESIFPLFCQQWLKHNEMG